MVAAPANAALVNGNFETVSGAAISDPAGGYRQGAVGWVNSGAGAGTFTPNAGIYDFNTGNVGVVNSGESLSQANVTILQSGGTYTFSGLYGNRNDFAPFNGSIGFFVGTTFTNAAVIAELTLVAPSVQGTLQNFSFTLASGLVNQFAGQQLGVFIRNIGGTGFTQGSYDNIALAAPIVTPIPGAAWLFGTVIAGAALRRRKQAA